MLIKAWQNPGVGGDWDYGFNSMNSAGEGSNFSSSHNQHKQMLTPAFFLQVKCSPSVTFTTASITEGVLWGFLWGGFLVCFLFSHL